MYITDSITLRPFEKEDLPKYRQWINNAEIASLIDRVLPVTETHHEIWYKKLLDDSSAVVFAVMRNDTSDYIGNVWLWNIDIRHRKAEVRIVIGDKSVAGKGFGIEALTLLSWFAFEKLNLHKLYAYVLMSNLRAIKAFERAGFSAEGVLKEDRYVNGRYEDVCVLAKIHCHE